MTAKVVVKTRDMARPLGTCARKSDDTWVKEVLVRVLVTPIGGGLKCTYQGDDEAVCARSPATTAIRLVRSP
jgi:hypothetical protein